MQPGRRNPPPIRRDRLIREREHDAYRSRAKLPEPSVCQECGAMYRDGRWRWGAAPKDAHRTHCPACLRVRDDYPGGYLHLVGPFQSAHREEIIGLLRNVEQRENGQHPLKRIMTVTDDSQGIEVTTTDPRLARNLGDAIHHAYRGELDYRYTEASNHLRVIWKR